MNIESIKSFLAVAKYKSISQAAHSLFISQPTLTNRMNKLENYLDLKLFERSWEGVHLTKEGKLFLPHALKMLDKLEEFRILSESSKYISNDKTLRSTDVTKSNFKIGINNYLVTFSDTIIELLSKKYPSIEFDITTGSTNYLLRKLDYNLLDYILYYNNKESLPNSTVIQDESIVFIFHESDYEYLKKNPNLINEIDKPLYLNSNPALNQNILIYKDIQHLLTRKNIIIINNIKLISNLINANKGYTILPESLYHYSFKNLGLKKLHIPEQNMNLLILSTFNTDCEYKVEISTTLNKWIYTHKNSL